MDNHVRLAVYLGGGEVDVMLTVKVEDGTISLASSRIG